MKFLSVPVLLVTKSDIPLLCVTSISPGTITTTFSIKPEFVVTIALR